MKKYIFILSALMLMLLSCKPKFELNKVVTVSILPYKYFTERIVGDRFDVVCMLSKGGSPEAYEPSMANMMSLEKSDAYLMVGDLGFETAIKSKIKDFNPDISLVDTSEGLAKLAGHHHEHDDNDGHNCGEEFDPHVWTSVANVRMIAKNICKAVCELDPDGENFYKRNYAEFDVELVALQDSMAAKLEDCKGKSFVVWHPALSYFAEDYGLEQISVEYDNKENPTRYMQNIVDEVSAEGAKVFFIQPEMDPSKAGAFNAHLQLQLVEVNPLSYDLEGELLKVADAIARYK